MHVALNEVGVLYASAVCHAGWDERADKPNGRRQDALDDPVPQDRRRTTAGHAFAIVGYTREASSSRTRGATAGGPAGSRILTYEDWLEHAMDCWVAQLGVVTDAARGDRAARRRCAWTAARSSIAADQDAAQPRDLALHRRHGEQRAAVDSGDVPHAARRTSRRCVDVHLDERAQAMGARKDDEPIDVAIYAHGGLTERGRRPPRRGAMDSGALRAQIFPIFLMWETDLWSTLKNRFAGPRRGVQPTTDRRGGVDQLKRFWNGGSSACSRRPASVIWGEMKQNADAITRRRARAAGCMLYKIGVKSEWLRAEARAAPPDRPLGGPSSTATPSSAGRGSAGRSRV